MKKCIVCGKANWQTKYQKLKQCKYCGFVRAKDNYFAINTKKLYTQKYFNGAEYLNYSQEHLALKANFTDRLKKIRKYKKSGKLLEIGCAYGYFLLKAKKYFTPIGIDLDPATTSLAASNSEVKVLTGDILKTKLPVNSFDVVCMFDVIEHLKNPKSYIKVIKKLLKKNGLVVIETGDIDSLLPKLQKINWRLITPPYHLQYFSQKTLTQLLVKQGFDIIYKTNNISFFRSVGQVVHRLNLPPALKKFLRIFDHFIFPTYTFDLVFIIGRKKS